MGLYVVANVDGRVISSVDGLEWSSAFDTGISIGKVAVGPNRIVYTRSDVEGEIMVAPGLYHTPAWNQVPVLAEGTDVAYFNEVHYLGGRYVAVGYMGSPNVPAHAYSDDGASWTVLEADRAFCLGVSSSGNFRLNDVGYNGTGYFMIGSVNGPVVGGGFYSLDITQPLGETQWVPLEDFPADANQLVYASYEGGEHFGAWSVFSDDRKTWWSTYSEDPRDTWNFINGWDMSSTFRDATGLDDFVIAEATIGIIDGYVVWMLSTANGQVMWWPHVPAGPFVSVPSPYTTTVLSVESLNPLKIKMVHPPGAMNNEKITISGATGMGNLNGVYFVKVDAVLADTYELHSDINLDYPIDASGWVGSYDASSATATMSRGTFIDALGYGDGKFFAGNDDEEVFVCSSIVDGNLVWTKVDDKNDSFSFWNDVEYGDYNGCTATYTYDFSPDEDERINSAWRYASEGNLDTAIITGPGGKRTSVQRTGYFEYLDSCGNRKSMYVRDGQTVTDEPEVPVVYTNPAGNPMVNPNTGSTV